MGKSKPNSIRTACLVLAMAGMIASFPNRSRAVSIDPGDILIADYTKKAVIRVDPVTGAQEMVSSGGVFGNPAGIAIAANGDIFIGNDTDIAHPPAVIRVDRVTGFQTTISSGGLLVRPWGIAIASNGDVFIADRYFGEIIRVDPATGSQSVVSSGGSLIDPVGIAIAEDGELYVADWTSRVIKINPGSGAQTIVSSGGSFAAPTGIAIAATGDIIVADGAFQGANGAVIRVDPSSGTQTVVSSGGSFFGPVGIAIASNGDLVVTNEAAFSGVIRVDPVTGAQTTVSSGGIFSNPVGIAIVPELLSVGIDIKPGGFPNTLNTKDKGYIPVAILSSVDFDAPTEVDKASPTFGRTGAEQSLFVCSNIPEDVNGDGLLDQVCHFYTQLTGFQVGDTQGILKGKTVSGVSLQGRDSVRIKK